MKNKMYKAKACTVIPNGVAMSLYAVPQQKEPIFTFVNVARLEYVKQQSLVIDAISRLKAAGRQCQLWLIGAGEDEEQLRKQAAALNVTGEVVFWGRRDDVPTMLARSHCFVLSSKWEGLPMSVIEAAAASLPVISTPVGSIPDFFSQEMISYATIDTLAAQMEDMLLHYDKYTVRAQSTLEFAKANFDINVVAQRHFEIYQKVSRK
jgi:glycosyltransferase involved in cell wall biosynthesis